MMATRNFENNFVADICLKVLSNQYSVLNVHFLKSSKPSSYIYELQPIQERQIIYNEQTHYSITHNICEQNALIYIHTALPRNVLFTYCWV